MSWEKNYKYWIKNSPKYVVEEIKKYTNKEKIDAFSSELVFGTAGLRGIMGYGTAKINEFTIAKYTLALGKMIIEKYGKISFEQGFVIAHDNRRNNILYSETAGEVLSALGIPVFYFNKNELQPTPLLSFVISKGKYIGGINITASHNPPNYNGFKVYNSNGIQMLPNQTNKIADISKEDVNIFTIKKNKNNINELSTSIVKQYIAEILNNIPFYPLNQKKILKVTYSAQHGTAGKIAKSIFERMGVDYEFVKEQMTPDPDFSNTISPNPQDPDSFILSRKYGDKNNSDILICTDPDADRFGIEVKHNGKWISIDGNQLPLIQLDYKFSHLKKLNYIESGDFIVRSVVTSEAADKIAEEYNVNVYENLTGFKWLITEAQKHELKGNECLFIWEESNGSTIRTFTRDKDSFQALCQIIEIVDFYKKLNMTLVDALEKIFKRIGYYNSPQFKYKLNSRNKKEEINNFLNKLRKLKINENISTKFKITDIIDYNLGYHGLAKDNFIKIKLNNKYSVTVRPSGTEPVLKIYFDVWDKNKLQSKIITNELIKVIKELFK